MNKNNNYNVVTLFCGCGGLDYGFKRAGFNILSANDCWDSAVETYNNNFDHKAICEDITEESTKQKIMEEIGTNHIHCLIGGPPCQAYSISGIRNPLDKRGLLFRDYIEMVNRIKPDFIVMENVKGILSVTQEKEELDEVQKNKLKKYYKMLDDKSKLQKDKKVLKNDKKNKNQQKIKEIENKIKQLQKDIKKYKKEIKDCMELVTDKIKNKFNSIGYKVKFKTLNAANFGVPQRRERVIFIGTRIKDLDIETNSHPVETHSESNDKLNWVTVKDAIGYLQNKTEDEKINHIFNNHTEKMIEKIKDTPIGESLYKTYGDSFHKCDPNKPSRTVKENHGGVFLHYKEPRCMTPRELAELQSFPKDFIFKGSKSNILKQIGNAVPVKLGEAIGNHINKLLDSHYKNI